MKFNMAKCKVTHLDQSNHHFQYRLGGERIESSPAGKDLGIPVDEKFDMIQQCVHAAQKTNFTLSCMKSVLFTGLRLSHTAALCTVVLPVQPTLNSLFISSQPSHQTSPSLLTVKSQIPTMYLL